ncbi:MAG: hypothetical protein IJA72_01790, partial [Clostridia bacterium]|nr:hypothetical protein [Clostridia bacterium]
MSKFKLINILDTLFIIITLFLIVFAWVQFFLKNFILSLFISLLLSLCIILFIRWLKSKKNLAYQTKQNHNTNFIKFKLAIQTLPNLQLIKLIKKLIPTKYSPKSLKGDITFTKNNIMHTFTFCLNTVLSEPLLLEFIKTKKTDNLTIICLDFDKSLINLAQSFKNIKISLINLEQLYKIFESSNISIDTSHIDLNKNK